MYNFFPYLPILYGFMRSSGLYPVEDVLIRDVPKEHNPLIGSLGRELQTFYKHLEDKLSYKRDFSSALSWVGLDLNFLLLSSCASEVEDIPGITLLRIPLT